MDIVKCISDVFIRAADDVVLGDVEGLIDHISSAVLNHKPAKFVDAAAFLGGLIVLDGILASKDDYARFLWDIV